MSHAEQIASSTMAPVKPAMAKKWLVGILVLTFAFILMPFLLWYMTTFSRPLSDADIAAYFADTLHPRRAQHALSQIADRIMSPNPAIRASAGRWYPKVVAYSKDGSDELRVTTAWVMGQDNQSPEFHEALLRQLADPNSMVERNAALSLVRFGDTAGHQVIAGMLTTYTMTAPFEGALAIRLKIGDVINPGTLVAHVVAPSGKMEVRSDVPGSIQEWLVADGASIQKGQPMLLVAPSPEMAWESLRALYLVGQEQDLGNVNRYAQTVQGIPPQVQQQAALTARAISARAAQNGAPN